MEQITSLAQTAKPLIESGVANLEDLYGRACLIHAGLHLSWAELSTNKLPQNTTGSFTDTMAWFFEDPAKSFISLGAGLAAWVCSYAFLESIAAKATTVNYNNGITQVGRQDFAKDSEKFNQQVDSKRFWRSVLRVGSGVISLGTMVLTSLWVRGMLDN